MRAMNTSIRTISGGPKEIKPGLPSRVNYYPPLIATLLAALIIFAMMAALAFFGVLNTLTQWSRASSHETGADILGASFCGLLTLVAFTGAVYFLFALSRGVRDLRAGLYYTRGTVGEDRSANSRRTRNWLLVRIDYAGPDRVAASVVTDEQRAASVDRAQIVQPRFNKGGFGSSFGRAAARERRELEQQLAAMPKPSTYLAPDRISTQAQTTLTVSEEAIMKPSLTFRSDFVSQVDLRPGEEVIVAHSRFLQHPYYVARLFDGEWVVYLNKALI